MHKTKGLSELIAAVLLIAFVIAVAAIVSTFSTGFSRGQIVRIQEEGGETVDCTFANVEIQPSGVLISNSTLYVAVKNTGSTDLTDIDVVLRDKATDPFRTVDLNETLSSNDFKSLRVNDTSGPVDRIIVTTNCPGKTDTVENVSGTFKRVT